MTTASIRDDNEHTRLVYPAEAISATEVEAFLANVLGVDCRLRLSDLFPSTKWDRNLVVVGGPVHNEVTRRLLESFNSGLSFDGHTIITPTGNRYCAVMGEGEDGTQRIEKDFGLVLRATNPFNSNEFITLLVGSRTFGCLVAARSMLHSNVLSTCSVIGDTTEFGFIATATILDTEIQEISIIESW